MSPATYSCTYDYMIGTDDFVYNDNMYPYCDGDRPRDELRLSYSSSESETMYLDSKLEYSQESKLQARVSSLIHGNPPFESKSHVAPEFEPSLKPCPIDRVIA